MAMLLTAMLIMIRILQLMYEILSVKDLKPLLPHQKHGGQEFGE